MLIFIGALYNFALPYWDTLNKKLSERGISSLTILHAPNLIGHPILIALLVSLGLFILPKDPVFYLSWLGLVVLSAFSLTLHLWGLVRTKFFGVQMLTKLGFLLNTIAAIFLLNEHVTLLQTLALGIATIAIVIFAWPNRTASQRAIVWDFGILFIILSQAIEAFSIILYKLAALHTGTYWTFLSGRLSADLIAWSCVWIVGLVFINKVNPAKELERFFSMPDGRQVATGSVLSNLVDSFLIYELPVVTLSILGTLTIPSAYFWSRVKYDEKISPRMWIGTSLGIAAILLFIYPTG